MHKTEGSGKHTEAQLLGEEREKASTAWGCIDSPRIESCMLETDLGR